MSWEIKEQEKREKDVRKIIMADMDEIFEDHPELEKLKEVVASYSNNGMIVMESFFRYAQEDGVLDAAIEAFYRADSSSFGFDDPRIRGNLDMKFSTREAYEKMLQESGVQWPRPTALENVTIVLPEHDELRQRLEHKLTDYQERLENPRRAKDAQHKIAALQTLLSTGSVNPTALKESIQENDWFDEESFRNAILVIEDYCNSAGRNTIGGTGLR